MPKYRVTSPDGQNFEINAPDGATQDQVMQFAQQQFTNRQKIREQIDNDPISKGAREFTKDSSDWENFKAGYGGALPALARGAGQLVRAMGPQYAYSADFFGLPGKQDEIDEARRLDTPLMKTKAGLAGNIAGTAVATLPAGGIPATGYKGAAMVGGALGLLQPVATGESRAANVAVGAVASPLALALGRGVNALYQGGKALLEPFTEAGRANVAGRMLNRFAENPNAIQGATSAPTITGARPTLAEQTGDAGLARLQDALKVADPLINNQITGRLAENNAARVNALRSLTGQDGARDFAVANRAGTTQPMYEDAFKVLPDLSALTPEQARTMTVLMRSPAIKAAMKEAQTIAANRGQNVGPSNASGSIEGMHNMKMALDDAIAAAKTAGNTNRASSIEAARNQLVSLIESMSPEYKTAQTVYAQMSKPINSMDVAREVASRGLSNTSDLAGNPVLQRNALLGALKDEPGLIRRATGRSGIGNSLADVMEPNDLNLLRTIASEADRAGAVAAAGNGPGSATAQRMASQNVLRQIIGPLGLPESWAENALANTVVKPLNLVYGGVAEPKIQQALARAVLSPDEAKAVLAAAAKQGRQLPPSTTALLLKQAGLAGSEAAAVSGQR